MGIRNILEDTGKALGQGLNKAATHAARAAATANGVSKASQDAQGLFNQQSANNANAIGTDRLEQMYQFNSSQAAMANAYNDEMWNKTAAWNEMMWEKQAEFNRQEAEKQRKWSEQMESTRYQRGMADMEKAGLNPILAYGGIATGAGSGGAASVGSASMSPMSGNMASGGTLNGLSASESNYSGQMEYMAGTLGLFGAAMDGLSAAYKAMSQNDTVKDIVSMLIPELHKNDNYGYKPNYPMKEGHSGSGQLKRYRD